MKNDGVEIKRKDKTKFKRSVMQTKRRVRSLKGLESQLKRGTKLSEGKIISLTDKDKKRIENEIKTLKSRV